LPQPLAHWVGLELPPLELLPQDSAERALLEPVYSGEVSLAISTATMPVPRQRQSPLPTDPERRRRQHPTQRLVLPFATPEEPLCPPN
jgi:hypothetical protein